MWRWPWARSRLVEAIGRKARLRIDVLFLFFFGLEGIFLTGKTLIEVGWEQIISVISLSFFFFSVTVPVCLNFLKPVMLGENFLLSQSSQVKQKKKVNESIPAALSWEIIKAGSGHSTRYKKRWWSFRRYRPWPAAAWRAKLVSVKQRLKQLCHDLALMSWEHIRMSKLTVLSQVTAGFLSAQWSLTLGNTGTGE